MPLPALHGPPGKTGAANGHKGYAPPAGAPSEGRGASPGSGPISAGAPSTVGLMVAQAREAAQPVLPPRPQTRVYPPQPSRSAWRSWPVVVIAVASLAIVGAVVLMAWPAGSGLPAEHKRSLPPPPAPERMQTEPDIKQRQPAVQPPKPAPKPDPAPAPPADPAPHDPSADAVDVEDDADDPMPNPLNSSQRSANAMALAMIAHVCHRMEQCGTDDAAAKNMCDTMANAVTPPPLNCPAADRCLRHIDTMSCGRQSAVLGQLNTLLTKFRDCAAAVRC